MKSSDYLQRFIFEHATIRGEIVHISESYHTILNQHPYPPEIKNLLGEALISCILLADSIKFEGYLSLQFQGDDRFPLLLAQCDHQLNIRACAKYKEGSEIDYSDAFINGQMSLVINQVKQAQAYQSIVPIVSKSMADNLMHYFAQSEQIPTKVWLAIREHEAAGMLLQLMPSQNSQEREQFWEYAVKIGQTIQDEELLTLNNQTILHRLYHETEIRLFDERAIHFQCQCNLDKMKQAVKMLGKDDAKQLLEEQGNIEICCDFCNKKYQFDAIDVEMLFLD